MTAAAINRAGLVVFALFTLAAPWILPLRVAVFAILIGQARLLSRSLITLAAGAGITLILSMGLGWITRSQGVHMVDALPEQITARLNPTSLIWESPWRQVLSRPTPRSTPVQ